MYLYLWKGIISDDCSNYFKQSSSKTIKIELLCTNYYKQKDAILALKVNDIP